jgi:membrane protein
MMSKRQNVNWGLGRLFRFILAVLRAFKRNQGLLLSGAVAYNTLLSIVPMSILALIVLSHLIGEGLLFATLSTYLEMLIPGYAAILSDQVRIFLEHRKVVGMIGVLFMLFFSSIAFMVLENAMSVILSRRGRTERRHFLISFIIPYAYIFFIGLAILLVSLTIGAMETLESRHLIIFGLTLSLGGTSGVVLYILGIMGEVLMLTSIYLIMPVVRSKFYHALIGGITATFLWEITRRLMVWYYSVLSMVNIIYGSFATAVVALLGIEAVAVIILLGAQVIAEIERKTGEKRTGFEI